MVFVELGQNTDGGLVVGVEGRNPVDVGWPVEVLKAQDSLLAGYLGSWLADAVLPDSGRPLPPGEFGVRLRSFGRAVYESFGELVVGGFGVGERVFVHCRDEAAAGLPLEAIALPGTEWQAALAPGGPSIVRTRGRPSDVPLWGVDLPLRVLMLDAVGGDGFVDKHRSAIESSVNACGGDFRYKHLGRLDDAVEALKWKPSIVHVLAHGVDGGVQVRLGPDGRSDVSGPELAGSFRDGGVRVAILNTCESSSEAGGADSLAGALLDGGVPVVVAARRPVGMAAMAAFTQGFFAALGEGKPVDECVRSGRRFVSMDGRPLHHAVITFHSSTTDLAAHPARELRMSRAVARVIGEEWRRSRPHVPFVSLAPAEVTSPSTLLRPLTRVMPFVGRVAELGELQEWRDGVGAVSVAAVVGEGGSGKTRLAIEFVEASIAAGWTAGFVGRNRGKDTLAALRGLDSDVVVVVDYAETNPRFVADLVDDRLRMEDSGRVLRVLLLMRQRPWMGRWMDPFLLAGDGTSEGLFDAARVWELSEQSLTVEERELLLAESVAAFGEKLGRPAVPVALPAPETAPLRIGAQALLLVEGDYEPTDLFGLVLVHERRWWKRTLPDDVDMAVTEQVVAVATLTGTADTTTLAELLRVIPGLAQDVGKRDKCATWANRMAQCDGALLGPDRLAEAHAVGILRQHPSLVADLIDFPDDIIDFPDDSHIIDFPDDSHIASLLNFLARGRQSGTIDERLLDGVKEHEVALLDRARSSSRVLEALLMLAEFMPFPGAIMQDSGLTNSKSESMSAFSTSLVQADGIDTGGEHE